LIRSSEPSKDRARPIAAAAGSSIRQAAVSVSSLALAPAALSSSPAVTIRRPPLQAPSCARLNVKTG
jgi:hypothetical protein